MGKITTSFCLINRIRPLIRVRSSPPVQAQPRNYEKDNDCGAEKTAPSIGRKIMIVVDSTMEAKNAVHWALTHTVQNHDLLILLHVVKPSSSSSSSSSNQDDDLEKRDLKVPEFLMCLKTSCELKRPEVKIEVAVVEGKEKGPTIVEAAKVKGVSLLVLGQKKRNMTWRLMLMWAGGNRAAAAGGLAEYCVQNATCMAIAVRRKSKKVGGYLITTKRQKDFWLLA